MSGAIDLSAFEAIKHINPRSGTEFWFARELQPLLEYIQWRNLESVIDKAKEACKGSRQCKIPHSCQMSSAFPLCCINPLPGECGVFRVKKLYSQSEVVGFARDFFANQGKKSQLCWRKARLFDAESRKNNRKDGC